MTSWSRTAENCAKHIPCCSRATCKTDRKLYGLARYQYRPLAHGAPFSTCRSRRSPCALESTGPLFIAELERVADGGSTLLDEIAWEYDGLFSFAVYLAAEKRDARAYGPLVRICHCSTERAHALFGDDVGTQLGRMLASVCDGDIGPLKALAEDSAADMWCRYAALRALVVRVVEGEGDRDGVLAYIEALAEREADVLRHLEPDDETENETEPDDFLTWAIDAASELGPAPLLEKIRGWFGEGLIDPGVTGLKWFEKIAAMPVADCIAEAATKEENCYIRDAL
ncbi:MAG: DUF1186 domain-containing protein, partial [Sulfurisoma sp.]|nr:DUF1186 domain-containing protein [Sulfurisoma sp.]